MSKTPTFLALVVASSLLCTACSQHSASTVPAPSASMATLRDSKGAQPASLEQEHTGVERKVVRTAAISLQVKQVDGTYETVRHIASSAGGFVSSSNFSSGSEGEKLATIELRVPAATLDEVVGQLAGLGKVVSRSETGQDMTEDYVDQESRMRNLEREESRLLDILGDAGSVKDLLVVEQELARVRGQIEQIQGHLKHVDQLVAYSTVTVGLGPAVAAIPPKAESFWNLSETTAYAWTLLLCMVRFALQTAIYAAFMLPLALPVWWLSTRLRRLRFQAPATP